jgi:hypothetical protein
MASLLTLLRSTADYVVVDADATTGGATSHPVD